MHDPLCFPDIPGVTKTLELEGRKITFRAFEQLDYCANPKDPIQKLNLFVPEAYYEIKCTHNKQDGGDAFASRYFELDQDKNRNTRLEEKKKAEEITERLKNAGQAVVTEVNRTPKKQLPPQLYDLTELQRDGNRKYGFSVHLIPQVRDEDGVPVSSSHIRFLLESGQITKANRLLGADYQILAHVITGNQLGSTVLGCPTANQPFEPWQCVPHRGVYASFAEINDIWVPAITNIGVRPTVTGGNAEPIAETHLIGWSGELVGRLLPVTLCRFLRPEQHFESLDALAVQMQRDIRNRMRLLPAEGNPGEA